MGNDDEDQLQLLHKIREVNPVFIQRIMEQVKRKLMEIEDIILI